MLTLEDFMNVRDLKQQGWSMSAIAVPLNLDRKTVRKYLRDPVQPYQRGNPAPASWTKLATALWISLRRRVSFS
jgi:transposase